MTTAADIATTTTPADMGRADWDSILNTYRFVTLHVEDSLDNVSIYTGRLVNIREAMGEVILEDVTRTRSNGVSHTIARRMIPLCRVRLVVWLHIPAA